MFSMRKDTWRGLVFWASRTQPHTASCLRRPMLGEGIIDADFEENAEVFDDFDGMAGFQV